MFRKNLLLALSLVLSQPGALALPQTAAPASTLPAQTQITVEGRRGPSDPAEYYAVDNPVFNPRLASSCNFLSAYNPYTEQLVLDYMRHFNQTTFDDGLYGGFVTNTLRDNAPLGDASTGVKSRFDLVAGSGDNGNCSGSDLLFGAGRSYIARKDKTLAEAMAAYQHGDFALAKTKFEANYRKLGYDISALMIAKLYLEGQGVPADPQQGIAWLRKVVDARFGPEMRVQFDPATPSMMSERAEAALILAKIYLKGHGVAADARQARTWYQVAADTGYAPAASTLGIAYLTGFAGEKNPAKALAYLKQAAEAGYAPGMYELGRLYYQGADGVPRDLNRAGAWFVAASDQGHAGAEYAAARMYDLGETVPPNPGKALGLYRDAAVKGLPDAQNALATYFYNGEIVAKDLATARKLFNNAAMAAQPDAMFNLAVMLGKGEGGPQDLAAAYVWYSLAGTRGHAHTGLALAEIRPQMSVAELAKAEAILHPTQQATGLR